MVLSGQTAFKRGVLTNLTAPTVQVQPCGIDITLKAVFKWTGAGVLDFSNTLRKTAEVEEVVLDPATASVHLPLGSYLVEFNELVDMPLDVVGHLYARSSLFRSGGLLHAGVIDSGYRGVLGGLLQVKKLLSPHEAMR